MYTTSTCSSVAKTTAGGGVHSSPQVKTYIHLICVCIYIYVYVYICKYINLYMYTTSTCSSAGKTTAGGGVHSSTQVKTYIHTYISG